MELGIGIDLLETGWSASVVKLGITLSLDGGVIFDASLHGDVIRQFYSGGSATPPAFSRYSFGLRIIM